MNYLSFLPSTAHFDSISELHQSRSNWVNQQKKGFLRYREPCLELSQFQASHVDCDNEVVTIGLPDEIDETTQKKITLALQDFMPWRKGPFSIFGTDVDAEWQSQRKWRRIVPELPDLKNKIVADVGCNNGYYMFRMVPHKPQLILGFEPSVQHYYCFKALNSMAGCDCLDIDLLGVEHLPFFESCFDVIFLLGIIYHRPSPIDTLRDILTALQPGGTLILESQAIPGDEPVALFPEKTYAKVPGTYFVPTATCLHNWMAKAGFKNIKAFCSHPMSSKEQRRTKWMVFESYTDFIRPENPQLTVEGYPAPLRVFFKGTKG
ncbi:tRNA 5-methoxyuridine(34)/uridine 5-oxyacetic acid(34) synthase CmoB [Desulfomarina sp.]